MSVIRRLLPWIGVLVAVLVIGYLLFRLFGVRPPREFTIATGREGGAYHSFALEYQEQLAKLGYTLYIRPTAGSIETLELLKAGQVDVGFVQTGTVPDEDDISELNSLASLFYEPMWIFYRTDGTAHQFKTIADLRGLRIGIGEEGSGSYPVALFILNENHIDSENSTLVTASFQESAKMLESGELDVAIMIMAPQARLVEQLLATANIDILSVDRGQAYKSRYDQVTTLTLTEGTINLADNIPSKDKHLLSAVAALVSRKDMHPDLGRLLLIVALGVHEPGGIFEKYGEFPSDKLVEIPMNKDAKSFLENGQTGLEEVLPLWMASRLERVLFLIVPFLVLFYPFFRSTPLAVAFFFRYRIFRWYQKVRNIEIGLREYSIEEIDQHVMELDELQQELTETMRVPVMYLSDFYNLRLHIAVIIQRLRERRQALATPPSSDDQSPSEQNEAGQAMAEGTTELPIPGIFTIPE